MQINSAGQYILSNATHPTTEKCHEQDNKKIANDAVQPKAVDTVEITGTDETKASGAIKNLQDGHYKGVADVRLRINFADQIAALENEQAKQIATNGATAVVQSVSDRISGLIASDNLTDQQAAAISEAVTAFESGAAASIDNLAESTTSPATTIDDIRSYFVNLTDAITAAATEPTGSDQPESADDGAVSTIQDKNATATNAAEDAPAFSIDNFLADLIASFESSMQQLLADLDSSSVLPEISEPSGQGKAYDKFMAIYNEMNQPIQQPAESMVNVLL